MGKNYFSYDVLWHSNTLLTYTCFNTSIHEIILLDHNTNWLSDVVWHLNILYFYFYNTNFLMLYFFFWSQNLFIWWPRNNTELLLTTGDIVWMKFVNDVTLFIFSIVMIICVQIPYKKLLVECCYTSGKDLDASICSARMIYLKKKVIRIDFYRPGNCYVSSISVDNEIL